jgi:hypothetical protein
VNACTLAKPGCSIRIDPSSDEQHVVGSAADVLPQQIVVVGDAIPESLEQTHPLRQVSPHDRAVRERMAQAVSPQLLVSLAKEACPEAEGHACDDSATSDRLALFEALDATITRDGGGVSPSASARNGSKPAIESQVFAWMASTIALPYFATPRSRLGLPQGSYAAGALHW